MNRKSNISSRVKDEVVDLYKSGESVESLSARYEISRQDVKQIVRGVKVPPEIKDRQRQSSITFNYGLIQGREESAAFCKETIREAERVKKEVVKTVGPFILEQIGDLIQSARNGEVRLKVSELQTLMQMVDKASSLDPTLIGIVERAQDRQEAAERFRAQQSNKSVFSGPMVFRESGSDEDSEE